MDITLHRKLRQEQMISFPCVVFCSIHKTFHQCIFHKENQNIVHCNEGGVVLHKN